MANEKNNGCIKLIAFIFSRVGITFLVIFYIIIGGIIFQNIESDHEKEENEKFREVERSTDNLVEEIWNMTNSELQFHDKKYLLILRSIVVGHKDKYLEALSKGFFHSRSN
jgi:hypothetical protein